jgi:hypothetical protein
MSTNPGVNAERSATPIRSKTTLRGISLTGMPLPLRKAEPWLRSLMGAVDLHRISTPIKVERETRIVVSTIVKGKRKRISVGQFDFSFAFRGTRGSDLKGSGRLFIPVRRPREPLPMVVSMHYEMDSCASARFLARGWAVMTPFGERSYKVPNLMGHGINHSVCMARLPRRMPFVDQEHVVLVGASAGGFHALMASSMVFPVTAVYAAVPILNLKYNINYLVRNNQFNVDSEHPEKTPAPIVKIVIEIANETANGGKPDTQGWGPFSPTFQTKLMTFPTVITYSTADALVPINQLYGELVQKPTPHLWPRGYSFELPKFVPDKSERLLFLNALGRDDYSLKKVKIPRDSPTTQRKREEMSPEEISGIPTKRLLWSSRRRFSIFVMDEGYPEPFCGHTKYHCELLDDDFYEHYMSRPSFSPWTLTKEKMVQLMQRFSSKEPDQGSEYEGDVSWRITRLDHEHLERWYAAAGLEIYMRGSRRNTSRAVRLYGELPSDLRVLDCGHHRFEEEPSAALMCHQILALEKSGDHELAETMRERP